MKITQEGKEEKRKNYTGGGGINREKIDTPKKEINTQEKYIGGGLSREKLHKQKQTKLHRGGEGRKREKNYTGATQVGGECKK